MEDTMNSLINSRAIPKSVLTKILFLIAALSLIVSLSVVQAQAKANTFTTNYHTDLNLRVFVPCAAAGAGEYVQLSGPLHIVFVTTLGGKGGFQSNYEFQPKGVSGLGLSTGTRYQGAGTTQGTFRGTVGSTSSFVDSFKVAGKGGSFLVRANVHVSVSAKGGLIVSVDNFSVTCKQGGYPSYP
jgi:hypothetical protein